MYIAPVPPNWFHNFIKKAAATRPGVWLLRHTLHLLDRAVLKLTRRRNSATTLMTGVPVIELITTGAKTGLRRTTILLALPHGQQLILVASFFGSPRHPAWYCNLIAHPEVEVQYRNEKAEYLAKETTGAERQACWQAAVQVYQGYEAYERKASPRRIPVILLSPNHRQP